ncbi:MAG: esterase family protein [Ignavibacteria bacterium]|nr:esterase family protein [Ignavibacteria bacterium]MBK6419712.1 esterase family protein [Ignavibacteria bacterium]MBK6759656.1 esterase family protein [Ignavibacteria bacterium]MBK7033157.1 esterase family protein [Ignavibacteria bacterium]MBK7184548.1 esterase family protein [Ignavibacteria bacterium]
MRRDITTWWSPNLNKNMEICAYGHYGTAILMFPSAAADYLEYERFYLIDSIAPFIEAGKIKVYSINSINSESWLNDRMHGREKSIRHQQYNNYVVEEVVPFIFRDCDGQVPIITSGVSLGALHAANSLFRRPDVFDGTIAMSGIYDLKEYSKGYFDEDCYFNSPMDYLPNLTDQYWLNLLRSKHHIHILTGSGNYEDPNASVEFGRILDAKGIPFDLDVWGNDYTHDWPTWRAMLPHVIGSKF